MMLRLKTSIGVFILFLSISFCFFYGPLRSGESYSKKTRALLLIKNNRISCKPVAQGQKAVSESLELKNVGSAPLVIHKVNAGCDCTATGLNTPLTIQPGTSKKFDVEIDTYKYAGAQTGQIAIHSNASNTPIQIIKVDFTVMPAISITPVDINLGRVLLSQNSGEFHLDVSIPNDQPFSALSIARLPRGVKVKATHDLREGYQKRYVFMIDAENAPLFVDDKIVFSLERDLDSVKSSVRFRCLAFSDCIVTPYPLSIGALPCGASRIMTYSLKFEKPVSKVAMTENKALADNQITIQDICINSDDDKHYIVSFAVTGHNAGVFQREFHLTRFSSDGVSRVIRLPVLGVVY